MQPQQPYGPNNQYDFIVSSGQPKKSLLPSLGGHSSFTQKIMLIVGGAVVLIIIMWVVGTLLGGGGGNTAELTKLVQQQQEIARVAEQGVQESTRTDVRNVAANTQLSLGSQQQQWLEFLANQGTEVKDEEQQALQNATTDQQLENATTSNSFDQKFLEVMRSHLTDYAATLQTAFSSTGNESEKELLRLHFDQTQLLLEQLPKS